MLEMFGIPSPAAFAAIIRSGFTGGLFALSDTLTVATPLILCGLACALAFKARLWNVGAEGQLFLGAWAATGVAIALLPQGTPGLLALTCMAIAGFAAGAAWGAIPGVLRARFGTSEILTSLMLVYVAVQWNNYFIYSVWSDRGFQMTRIYPREFWLPRVSDLAPSWPGAAGLTLHAGFLLALLLAALLWFVLFRTRFGFELKVTGVSERAAHYAGMPVKRNIVLSMALSGGLAGLAGMCETAGVVHRLQENFSPGYGFTAILVAWLARLDPAAIVLVSVLLSGLLVGAREIQPSGIAMMMQGIILTSVVAADFFSNNVIRISTVDRHGGS
jgi:simple sugar transport system permease protein